MELDILIFQCFNFNYIIFSYGQTIICHEKTPQGAESHPKLPLNWQTSSKNHVSPG